MLYRAGTSAALRSKVAAVAKYSQCPRLLVVRKVSMWVGRFFEEWKEPMVRCRVYWNSESKNFFQAVDFFRRSG